MVTSVGSSVPQYTASAKLESDKAGMRLAKRMTSTRVEHRPEIRKAEQMLPKLLPQASK